MACPCTLTIVFLIVLVCLAILKLCFDSTDQLDSMASCIELETGKGGQELQAPALKKQVATRNTNREKTHMLQQQQQ